MTTPDPVLLQRSFRQFADAGARSCAIEASSIGLAEHRLVGTRIPVAVFTNFTQDHLDYHASMEAYWQAKAALFDWPGLRAAAINIDDPQGAALHDALQGRGIDLWSLSQHTAARLSATTEVTHEQAGVAHDMVQGRLLPTGKAAAMYAGELPADPARLLSPARQGAPTWLDADYALMHFAPARLMLRPGEGPPHIGWTARPSF